MTDAPEKTEQPEKAAENGGAKPGLFSRFNVAEWFAVWSVLAIVVSFAWEWGYWSFFGVSLAEMPMSLENLAGAILAWMPFFLLTAMTLSIFFLWLLPNLRDCARLWMAIDIVAENNHKIWFRIADAVAPAVMVISITGLLAAFVFPVYPKFIKQLPYLEGLSAVGFYCFLRFFRVHFAVQMFFYAAVLIWAAFSAARFVASEDIMHAPLARIEIKLNGEFVKREMRVLRNSHDFVYAYDPTNKKLSILPWRLIERVSYDAGIDAPVRIPSIFRKDKKQP